MSRVPPYPPAFTPSGLQALYQECCCEVYMMHITLLVAFKDAAYPLTPVCMRLLQLPSLASCPSSCKVLTILLAR